VDAAALTGIRNLSQGQAQAKLIAQSSFNMNYGTSGRDSAPPTVTMNFTTDANNNTYFTVNATSTINTFLISLLPRFKTLAVSSQAQGLRPPVVMTLVLDRSGSMKLNGGNTALPPAVTDFVSHFNSGVDQVAMTSFSSDATLDVSLTTNFQTPISNAANGMCFGGATWAQGGLQYAQTQENSVAAVPNQVKAVVFFTDGWANANQDILSCSTNPITYGGCAPPEAAVGWCSGISYWNQKNDGACGAITDLGSCGSGFPSQLAGSTQPFTQANISNDAMYRAVQLANTLRTQGIYVFSIGLGDKINTTYMQQMANDPSSPTYNSAQLTGYYASAPDCPGSGCAGELDQAFLAIANKILLRLAQ
jgi:hypothetical protein